MVAAAHPVPAAGGSDASAHFCVTSGWRSRCTSQRPSTTALVRRWSQWRRGARRRWRLKLCTTPHGDRSSLHRGCGRAVPRAAAAGGSHGRLRGCRAPRLTPVVLVQDAALDDKTIAWLLERSLAERQREEEEAVEAAVLAELEEKVAVAEGRLLVELQREREDGVPHLSSDVGHALSCGAACRGVVLGQGRVGQEEGEEEEEEEEDETQKKMAGGLYFFAPLYLTVTCLTLVLPEEYVCCFFREIPSRGFSYSTLGGSSVDTCLRLFTVAFVVDNSAMAGFAGDDALRAVVGRPAARSASFRCGSDEQLRRHWWHAWMVCW